MAVLDAQGATFSIDNSGSTPVAIGGIVSFSGLDGAAANINVTTLDSKAMEYRPGIQDFGSFSIEVMYDPSDAGQVEIEAAKAAQAIRTGILTLASGDVATFEMYVQSFSIAGGVDAVVTGSASFKITGVVVWS